MTEIEIALNCLKNEGYACAIVKDFKLVYLSKDRGIFPLFEAKEILKLSLHKAVLADKVIGKAAAMIAVEAGITDIYGVVMSEHAIDYIKESNINFSYKNRTPYIKNRELSGMCPVETLAIKSSNYNELIPKIEEFLKSVNMI